MDDEHTNGEENEELPPPSEFQLALQLWFRAVLERGERTPEQLDYDLFEAREAEIMPLLYVGWVKIE